jgi:hypothetical protein
MKYPPSIETSVEDLPNDPKARHQFLVDVFGRYLFWAMDESSNLVKSRVESKEARDQLERARRETYEKAANALTPEQQGMALALAREAVQILAKQFLAILEAHGISHRLGQEHAIRFRLIMEICETADMKVVFEEVINRGGEKAFASYWGRWLHQNEDLKQKLNEPGR